MEKTKQFAEQKALAETLSIKIAELEKGSFAERIQASELQQELETINNKLKEIKGIQR